MDILAWMDVKRAARPRFALLVVPSLKVLLQAASKTNDTAGDGTTTATILSAAIIAEGMKIVAAGTNPVQLTRGIEKTVAALVKELKALSVDVSDDDLANVATVSAGNNEVVRACALSRPSKGGSWGLTQCGSWMWPMWPLSLRAEMKWRALRRAWACKKSLWGVSFACVVTWCMQFGHRL